jgi:hypothetical protein
MELYIIYDSSNVQVKYFTLDVKETFVIEIER